ncbi:MAG: DUF2490 domain-containing protein [Tannerella sp.]|nr:DUF2490 domain-containing protein [Tannerella sp.]
MRYSCFSLITLVVTTFCAMSAHAQAPAEPQPAADYDDLALWMAVSLQPDLIPDKLTASFDFEYRRRNNLRETDLYNGIVIVDYLINKHLTVGLGYEMFWNNNPDGYETEYRYYPELIYAVPFQRFSLSLRMRVMNTFTDWNHPSWEHRNRLKIKYSIKSLPISPFASVEPYNQLGRPMYRLNKVRYSAGFTFSSGHHSTDLYYMLENYHTRNFARHVININYTFSF